MQFLVAEKRSFATFQVDLRYQFLMHLLLNDL
jgi:hypothetical protein